jgi:hypothetical protein
MLNNIVAVRSGTFRQNYMSRKRRYLSAFFLARPCATIINVLSNVCTTTNISAKAKVILKIKTKSLKLLHLQMNEYT